MLVLSGEFCLSHSILDMSSCLGRSRTLLRNLNVEWDFSPSLIASRKITSKPVNASLNGRLNIWPVKAKKTPPQKNPAKTKQENSTLK